MSYIHNHRAKIEKKCEGVYHTEGLEIANKLLMTCLIPKYQHAVGLAHNQIGGNKQVFVAKLSTDTKTSKWRAFINAKVTDMSPNTKVSEEGCMTFPNKPNKVERHEWVEVEHQVKARNDHTGDAFIKEKFYGYDAIIVQHECDHLNGYHIHNQEEK